MNYNSSNQPLMVSVSLITYNQKDYIAQAIESVLSQKVDFRFELIIGDDFSTDGTREIILAYQQKHPNYIKPIMHPRRNIGIPGKLNFLSTIYAAKGKYIALLDGDDYWSDNSKMQKQVDFLETNSDFAICFHRVKIFRENADSAFEEFFPSNFVPGETTFEDLSKNNFVPTLSCVFRNRLFEEFPDWYGESPAGDYPLHLLNAEHGKLKYFDEVMGHYRMHDSGAWSLIADEQKHEKWLTVLNLCKDHFYPKGLRGFEKQIANAKSELCFIYFKGKKYKKFREYFLQLVKRPAGLRIRTIVALGARFVVSHEKYAAELYRKLFMPN